MTRVNKITSFGHHLRDLRESRALTLKQVAEHIGMDISLLAKIERNERRPTKQMIRSVADLFNCDERELLNDLLSDQIAYKILEEEADPRILKVAEQKVQYLKTINNGK